MRTIRRIFWRFRNHAHCRLSPKPANTRTPIAKTSKHSYLAGTARTPPLSTLRVLLRDWGTNSTSGDGKSKIVSQRGGVLNPENKIKLPPPYSRSVNCCAALLFALVFFWRNKNKGNRAKCRFIDRIDNFVAFFFSFLRSRQTC